MLRPVEQRAAEPIDDAQHDAGIAGAHARHDSGAAIRAAMPAERPIVIPPVGARP